jgi:hypothetical protein
MKPSFEFIRSINIFGTLVRFRVVLLQGPEVARNQNGRDLEFTWGTLMINTMV